MAVFFCLYYIVTKNCATNLAGEIGLAVLEAWHVHPGDCLVRIVRWYNAEQLVADGEVVEWLLSCAICSVLPLLPHRS